MNSNVVSTIATHLFLDMHTTFSKEKSFIALSAYPCTSFKPVSHIKYGKIRAVYSSDSTSITKSRVLVLFHVEFHVKFHI